MASYKVASTERTTAQASNAETKALLYLMNLRDDSDEIFYFVVDFFNDVTGMNKSAVKMWDVQSKSSNNVHPQKIGQNLVTLYKNFLSDFEFHSFILFMGSPSNTVRIDDKKTSFGIDNIKPSALKKIFFGLKNEALRVSYIDSSKVSDNNLYDFLDRVLFVVDDKEPYEYIRPMIKVKPELIPDNNTLTGIFNEIRNQQTSKKNGRSVENITISLPQESLNYFRHLESDKIKLLVLSRAINVNPMDQNVPRSFIPIINNVPPEEQKEFLEDRKIGLCRAFFDKNNGDLFWGIFEEICSLVRKNPKDNVNQLYARMNTVREQSELFDIMTLKFFIAKIMDGLEL